MAGFRVLATLLLVLVLTNASHGFDVSLNDALDLIRLGRETVVEVLESYEMLRPHNAQEEGDDLFVKRMEKELRQRIDRVSKKIDAYQERMETKTDTILTQLLLRLPLQRRLDDSLKELDHYVGQVHGLYKTFETYADNTDRYEKYTVVQFAKACVSPRLGELSDVLKSMHRLMVPSEQQVYNRSILVLLAHQMQETMTVFQNCYQHIASYSSLMYRFAALAAILEHNQCIELFQELSNFFFNLML